MVILGRRSREAQHSRAAGRAVLADLGLTLHPAKTRLGDLDRGKAGVDFLGGTSPSASPGRAGVGMIG